MDHMLLVLKRSPEREAALEQFLAAQHDSNSPDYQHWLTPEQFGERFGATSEDLDRVTAWLRGHGFAVHDIPAGRQHIDFSGVATQVEQAFRTEMRRYDLAGERHVANTRAVSFPAELRGVIDSLSLTDFRAKPQHQVVTVPDYNSGGSHYISPYDFATIYNVTPLWNAGTDGTGQTIAIIGRAVVSQSDYATFRSMFGLPAATLQVATTSYTAANQNGGDLTEAVLDVEWSGAVAKGATVLLVASTGSQTADGVDLAIAYAINNNVAPIVSVSFGLCEYYMGSNNAFYNNTFRQAAAQGMSVFVSTGDSGSAGCDYGSSTTATGGLAINGLASTPYNVAVGGTQFNEGAGSYWNATADSHQASAKSFIPELVWNQSSGGGLWAGSGGVSTLYATPAWQTGTGVPAGDPGATTQHHRYIPDVSLTAASHDGYLIYQGSLGVVAGTSASAPSFAGLMALVNQRAGARQGLPNPRIYALASQVPAVFHDTTGGTTAVPCSNGSANCSGGVLTGYAATAGYDLATGWGSVDANALVSNWTSVSALPQIISITPNPISATGAAQSVTLNGSGFTTGAGLQVVASYSGGTPVTLSGSSITASSTTSITVSINFGTTARTWSFQVTNPNSQQSNTVTLTVNAPPVITSFNPNPMTGSSGIQTLTVNGTGFQSGAGLTLIAGYTGYSTTVTGANLTFVSATQLTAKINVGTTARTWALAIVNPDATPSNITTLSVTAGSAAPAITSFSPNPMTGSASTQTLTINGTGFQSGTGLAMVAGYTGNTLVLSGTQITSVSATQIQVQINVGTTARSWALGVVNPGGISSNVASFQVNAPAPVITSFTPNPMTGSTAAQALTINGTGFQSGMTLITGYTGYSNNLTGTALNVISSTQMTAQINVGVTARTWALAIVNPDGGVSNVATVAVRAPVVPPAITSINALTASSSSQTLTINGSGFQSGSGFAIVAGYTGGTSQVFSGSQITSVTATQIQLPINVGTTVRTWAVGVINPGGVSSNVATLAVNAPAPTITSFNPSPMGKWNGVQTLTINGTGFVAGTGLSVVAGYTGNIQSITGNQVYFISPTQLWVQINVGNTARTWAIAVVNPDASASNIATLVVQ